MLKAFQEHIAECFPNLRQKPFLLACSGGVDSMVLAHLCKASQMDFALAHCNFQLRGEECKADEDFVRNTATENDLPFFVTHFDTVGYISKHRVSVQMAARYLRYAWFAEIMQQHKIPTLVTAHHADDKLETFFINLSRGTGIDGLIGIPAKTDHIARPLLPFSRNEIESYAKSNAIKWREDSSNLETKYLRNKIRQEIVPLLKELHPTFLNNFGLTQSHLNNTARMAEASIEKIRKDIFIENDGVINIDIGALRQLQPTAAYLYGLFKKYGFTAWSDIGDLLSATSGKEVRSNTHRLLKDRTTLLLTELTEPTTQEFAIGEDEGVISAPIRLRFEEVSEMGAHRPDVLYVDQKTLKYPLTVRKAKNGDYFYPFGMEGKKKLSKYFKDEKLNVIAKERQWLLCTEEAIVWVIGRRGDNRFKVTGTTEKIIKITLD